ncbi:MAG: peptide deformylase [Cytophagaceae bacterium]|nr:peptide deformylase [Cytophagaceae bacterium]MDW8457132.1 peptide deformylase [Cytophagaceae bacterium]
MILPIVAYGDPVLKKRADDITPQDPSIVQLISDMYETMYQANGIGLAAPQIGKSIRLFITDASLLDDESVKDFKKVFINPTIEEEFGEEWSYEEGCLSIPGIRGEVSRYSKLRIRYFDERWNEHVEEYDGMPARIIQHEYDHIEGKLFIEYFSPLKKQLLKNKLANISKGIVDVSYKMKFPVKKK